MLKEFFGFLFVLAFSYTFFPIFVVMFGNASVTQADPFWNAPSIFVINLMRSFAG